MRSLVTHLVLSSSSTRPAIPTLIGSRRRALAVTTSCPLDRPGLPLLSPVSREPPHPLLSPSLVGCLWPSRAGTPPLARSWPFSSLSRTPESRSRQCPATRRVNRPSWSRPRAERSPIAQVGWASGSWSWQPEVTWLSRFAARSISHRSGRARKRSPVLFGARRAATVWRLRPRPAVSADRASCSTPPLSSSGWTHMARSTIAITMGDPAGVGPEIVLAALAAEPHRAIVVGDARRLKLAGQILPRGGPRLRPINSPSDAHFEPGLVNVVDLANVPADLPWGELSEVAGAAAFGYLEHATRLALEGEGAALCTAPINKEAWREAGIPHPGHT